MKFLLVIFKNVRRNLLRSTLTALGTMVLVSVVILIWSMLALLDSATEQKSQNFKAIVTERWRIPSLMPFSYAATLSEGAAEKEGDVRPTDSATWQFYGGSLDPDPKNRTRDNMLFAVATEPKKILTMFDELDTLRPGKELDDLTAAVRSMEQDRRGIIIGRERLAAMNKKVGERITIYSMNYKGIDLEFEIVGTFPESRWNNSAAMNRAYILDALDAYNRSHPRHPMSERNLNLVWLKVPDTDAFHRVGEQILKSPSYASTPVKCETAASAIASFLEAFRDLVWGLRWLLSPAIMVTLSLVIANAISISVRERRTEFAVLKVLGFRPWHILLLVLGEALLIGVCAGLTSAALTYAIINWGFGGLKFQIAFFTSFLVPVRALWWGMAIGAATALVGSVIPAWAARNVKVAEVFAKVA